MYPNLAQQQPNEYPVGKIYTLEGLDRITSDMALEADTSQLFYFPFIKTPLLQAINVN